MNECAHTWLNIGEVQQCVRCLSVRPRFPHPVLQQSPGFTIKAA